MPYVEVSKLIKGEGRAVYDIISDMEAYPSFMKDLVSAKVSERGPGYDISSWTERDCFYPEEVKITYQQTAGDLKKMEGAWTIEPRADGCWVTLAVDFEFGIPMIAGLLNPILKRKVKENSENMLAAIKKQVEGA